MSRHTQEEDDDDPAGEDPYDGDAWKGEIRNDDDNAETPGADGEDESRRVDEGPGEHDRHLVDDDYQQTVPCARCGKPVWAYAQKCPHCGVWFHGEAWQFHPAGGRPRPDARRRWFLFITVLVLLAIAWLTLHLGHWL